MKTLPERTDLRAEEIQSFCTQGVFMALKPGHLIMGWGTCERKDHPSEDAPSFYVPDFFLRDKHPWLCFEQVVTLSLPTLVLALKRCEEERAISPRYWTQPDRRAYQKQFNEIMTTLRAGTLKKAVPVVFERSAGAVDRSERIRLLSHVLAHADSLLPYGFWRVGEGLLGATPEPLFHAAAARQMITSLALAGTRDAAEKNGSLLDDPKECREHELVVRFLRERLETLGDVVIGETLPWQVGRMVHLRTPVHVKNCSDMDFSALCRLLHPTPALGLYPPGHVFSTYLKSAIPRRRFGAPFGVCFPDGGGVCLVAIRCIQWNQECTLLGAGGGLVEQSVEEREWEELTLKRNAVKRMFGWETLI